MSGCPPRHESEPTSNSSDPHVSLATLNRAEIVVPRYLNRSFTYAIPDHLRARIRVGSLVKVPFGKSTLQGLVIAFSQPETDQDGPGGIPANRLREILAFSEESGTQPVAGLPTDLLTLLQQVSTRYLTPWGQCLRLALPSSPVKKPSRRYGPMEPRQGQDRQDQVVARLSPTARAIVTRLANRPKGLTLTSLKRGMSGSVPHALSGLLRRGLVRELTGASEPASPVHASNRRGTGGRVPWCLSDADSVMKPAPQIGPTPSNEETTAGLDRIRTGLEPRRSATLLLQCSDADRLATLVQATRHSLAVKRRVLILAPEIARVSAIARTATLLWGERVAVFHSGMAPATRAEVWQSIRTGVVDVVVGTRSAIFAPLESIGLIWVEGEEDPSFKEEQAPRYHARDVARMRAHHHQAVLVLASAHPSVETLCAPDVELLPLREGPFSASSPAPAWASMPMAEGRQDPPGLLRVDLRHSPFGTFLSEAMLTGIETAMQANSGAILFLNRKGFAPALLCRDCGQAPQCSRCSVTLTFYRTAGRMACSYCGTSHQLSDTCPSCLAPRLEPVGFGTERLEEELRRLFPTARIGRLDGDRARTPAQGEAIRQQAAAGEFAILIGTQMLFQGSPLPPVGFVGLPHADAGLHLADFRASERTYHGLLDAVALAHPAARGGKVVLQTFLPSHHVIEAIFRNDPKIYFEQELRFRQDLAYPPFSHLIRLGVSSPHAEWGRQEADRWASLLNRKSSREPGGDPEVLVLGPVPAPMAKLRGRYRWQLLIRAFDADRARQLIAASLAELDERRGRNRVKFDVDVDPVDLS